LAIILAEFHPANMVNPEHYGSFGCKLKPDRGLESAMRPSEALPRHRETIRQLVLQAGMANPRVFGSVVRGEDREDSDLDILVDPAPRASLLAMEKLQAQLEKATGVKIDLRTPEEINQRFRGKVLTEAAAL
jgi:predicted nucleotidyltransferase